MDGDPPHKVNGGRDLSGEEGQGNPVFPRREEGPGGSKVTVRSDRLDFRVRLGEIRRAWYPGLGWTGWRVKAGVPGGRGRSYRAGMAGTAGQSGPNPTLPHLPHCLTGPCQGQGKAQNREPHGVQGQAGAELVAGSLAKGALRPPPLPQELHPCPAGTQMLARLPPCFLGPGQPSPTPRAVEQTGLSTCSAGPQSRWKHSCGRSQPEQGLGLPTGPELVSRGRGVSGGRNRMVEEPLTSTTKPQIP